MSSSEVHSAIEVSQLTKHYGAVKAIENVSFSVKPGQIVGFLGPNGAGKSTTMRILCGLMSASSGTASICGIPVASRPYDIKRRVGYMPEHNPLPEDMRVVEYLRYRAQLKEIPRRVLKKSVDETMEICDLHRKARRRVIGTLSKGYRQRVGIADAILGNPEVIIMDEPTIGLDPHQILGIRQLINDLRGKMTVMLSSHILPEIEMCCDKVIIINQGRIVANGTPASLREEFIPKTRFRLQIKGNLEDIQNDLAKVDPDITLRNQETPCSEGFCEVLLEAPQGKEIAEKLLKALNSQPDYRLREMALLQPNLEDIFMAATKRSWDETAAPFVAQTRRIAEKTQA